MRLPRVSRVYARVFLLLLVLQTLLLLTVGSRTTDGAAPVRWCVVGIRVKADAAERIAASPDRFAIQIQGASDLQAALAATRLARVDLVGLSGRGARPLADTGRDAMAPNRADVSQVVAAPAGPLLLVQHLGAAPEDLARVPELLVRRLEEAGVETATVAAPQLGGALDALDSTTGCVVLRLFPQPLGTATTITADWLDVAVEWVIGDLADGATVAARILSVEHEVPAAQAAGLLHECGVARAWCDLVNGDLDDRIRSASLTYGRLPHLALAAGGPGMDHAALLARFEVLQDVARELAADVAYASLDFEPTFEGLSLGLPVDGWRARGGASPNLVAATIVDTVVPDACPWQILGPAHVARLEAAGITDLPVEHLTDGRVELALGPTEEWLPRSGTRLDAQEDAIEWLAALLVDQPTAEALVAQRPSASAETPASGLSRSPFLPKDAVETGHLASGVPDLGAIVLRGVPTPRRAARLSPLELAAWFAHEQHSDAPTSVSPTLATFVRWWAAGLDDDTRQRLKPFVARLVGTAGDEEAEQVRRWLAADWLIRTQAPAWLRLAGLGEAADRLATVGDLTIDLELVRAVDVLGSAITIASRRIDITSSIVTGEPRDRGDDQPAWEAWERVTEPTAWVAASETATYAVPGEIAYATDLRVIECSRDPRVRDEIEATRTSVGNTAWTTALHAIADEVWEQAWRAADRAAREVTGLTIRVEMGRVAKTVLLRSTNEEFPETALEQAEQAARDALTRAALRRGEPDRDGEHPWDAARAAARSSPGGAAWAVVVDESRRAIGEEAWGHAMADARGVTDAVLTDAPDVVARVVAAAVAREACSVAARGVAYRAAAVARAHGADDLGAEQAANDALAPTATELRESAFDLLDRLIDAKGAP